MKFYEWTLFLAAQHIAVSIQYSKSFVTPIRLQAIAPISIDTYTQTAHPPVDQAMQSSASAVHIHTHTYTHLLKRHFTMSDGREIKTAQPIRFAHSYKMRCIFVLGEKFF